MPDSSNAGPQQDNLDAARRCLREKQEEAALKSGVRWLKNTDNKERTLQALSWRRQFTKTNDPAVVKRGVFKFDRKQEEERINLAEELVRRVEPGPFESPNYLALLAYQAASVELVLSGLIEKKERLSKVLLGTIYRPDVNAGAYKQDTYGYTIVAVNSGLVELIYQAAKAVTEALNPVHAANGRSGVVWKKDLEEISAGLSNNSAPINRVWKTLEAYFFYGKPRAYWKETVKEEYQWPLGILISMAERFAIAHEYGHGLRIEQSGSGNQYSKTKEEYWDEEYGADAIATIATALSAQILDAYSPEFPLSGGLFCLSCIDILRKTLVVLRNGTVPEDTGSDTHPPNKKRQEQIIEVFRHYEGGTLDVGLVAPRKTPDGSSFSSDRSEAAFLNADVLQMIWEYVKEILLRQPKDRHLHPMWNPIW